MRQQRIPVRLERPPSRASLAHFARLEVLNREEEMMDLVVGLVSEVEELCLRSEVLQPAFFIKSVLEPRSDYVQLLSLPRTAAGRRGRIVATRFWRAASLCPLPLHNVMIRQDERGGGGGALPFDALAHTHAQERGVLFWRRSSPPPAGFLSQKKVNEWDSKSTTRRGTGKTSAPSTRRATLDSPRHGLP